MKALLAWMVTYWVISVPLLMIFVGSDYDNGWEVLSTLLIIVISWILANRVERAVEARG